MATLVYKNCKLYLGGYDLSGDMNKLALNYGAEMLDNTVFNNDTRSNKAGLFTVGAAHEGFWQANDDDYQIEDILMSKFAAANEIMTVCPEKGAVGEVGYSFKSILASYVPDGAVGELFKFTLDASGTGKLIRGTIMENAIKTSTGDGVASQLGKILETQKIYAAMHVLAVNGTNPTLDMILQSDDAVGFSDPLDRITFEQVNSIGAQWKELAGAVTDDWWRLSWTIGGSDNPKFTVVVVVAIH